MVKKAVWALLAIVVLAVAGLLAAPAFIDWNQYKREVADATEQATGRRLEIGGDLSLSLLPLPALTASNVRLANAAGGTRADMLTIAEIRVRVSLFDLLGGHMRVQSVHLVGPDLLLEQINGRANWAFQPLAPPPAAGGPTVSGPLPPANDGAVWPGGLNLALDRITVEGGQITLHDPDSDHDETLSGIDAELSAVSLNGPFKAQGIGRLRHMSVLFEGSLGDLGGERAAPLNLVVHSAEGAAELRVSGLLGGSSEGRILRGDVRLKGEDLTAFLNAAGAVVPTQGLHVPFALNSRLTAAATVIDLPDIVAQVDQSAVQGKISYAFGRQPRTASVVLTVGSLDLDAWIRGGLFTAPEIRPVGADGLTEALLADGLPGDLTADLSLEVQALTWRGAVVSQARIKAGLDKGVLTLDDASARLPGSSSARLSGTVKTPDGLPTFDLVAEAQSYTLRNTLEWLGLDVSGVSGGRLNSLQASASVGGTWREVIVRDLKATVDTTTLRGAATLRPGPRPALGVALDVASLSIDAYHAPTPPGDVLTGLPTMASLGVLGTFDMNLRADLGRVTWNDVPLSGVHLDLGLIGGRLIVREARVEDAAGADLSVVGSLGGFGSVATFDGLTATVQVPDVARFSRGFALDVPAAVVAGHRVDGVVTLTGTGRDLGVSATGRVGQVDVAVEGAIADPFGASRPDIVVSLAHPEARDALAMIWPDYRPRGALGSLVGHTRIVRGETGWRFEDSDLEIGDSQINGLLTLDLATARRPTVTLAVTGPRLNLDAFRRVSDGPAGGQAPWATMTLDVSGLADGDGELTVNLDQLVTSGVTLTQTDAAVSLADGVLTVDHVTGQMEGGAVTASGRLEATATGGIQAMVASVEGQAVGLSALTALSGTAGDQPGQATFTASLRGTGETMAGFMRSLQGSGTLAAVGVGPGAVGQGPVAAALAPASALTRFALLAEGGPPRADINAMWAVQGGTVKVRTAGITGPEFQGTLSGTMDLNAWTVDLTGEARFAEPFLRGLSAAGQSLPGVAPMLVNGSLYGPVVRVGARRAPPAVEAPPPVGTNPAPRFLDRFLGPPDATPDQPYSPQSTGEGSGSSANDALEGAPVTSGSVMDAIRQGIDRQRSAAPNQSVPDHQ